MVALAAALGIAATYTFLHAGVVSPEIVGALNNLPSVALSAYGGAVTIWVALRYPSGDTRRAVFGLLGIGAFFYVAGSVVWAYYEMFVGPEIPYPGPPDIFFILQYVPLIAGVCMALIRVGRSGFGMPLTYSAALVIMAGTPSVTAISRETTSFSASGLQNLLGFLYPVLDLVLLWPALALGILLIMRRSGYGAIPWWCVVFGIATLTYTDTAFSIQALVGTYQSGGFLDLGWILSFLWMAVGASLMLDFAVDEQFTSRLARPRVR